MHRYHNGTRGKVAHTVGEGAIGRIHVGSRRKMIEIEPVRQKEDQDGVVRLCITRIDPGRKKHLPL